MKGLGIAKHGLNIGGCVGKGPGAVALFKGFELGFNHCSGFFAVAGFVSLDHAGGKGRS